jgi:hypothetical protein
MELTAVALPDQKTDPYGAVVSEKWHMVSIAPYKKLSYMNDNAIFNVIVENGGEEPITIGNENISMIFEGHDKKRTVKKLDVLSAREFMNDVLYKYQKRMINDMVYFTRDNDYIYADSGLFNVIFANVPNGYSTSRYLTLEETFRKLKTLRETLPDLILNQKTIMPRESIAALISCRTNEIPRGIKGDFKISVSIDGEEHLFTFNRR